MSLNEFIKQWLLPPGISAIVAEWRGWAQYRFKLTAADRALLEQGSILANRHLGKRCFIVGAGSSIQSQDIKQLQGEYVISVSNTFVHPDMALVRPQYHVTPAMMQGHGKLYELERYVNWLREMEAGTFDAEMVFHIGDRPWIEEYGLFKERRIHWVNYTSFANYTRQPIDLAHLPYVMSVSETAISLAIYLGFDEIYLLGIDHDWFNGLFKYFYDHKTQHAAKPDETVISHVDAEFQMRRHAEIFRKYKYLQSLKQNIYNANPDPQHYLDVFPQVDFDTLFGPEVHLAKGAIR